MDPHKISRRSLLAAAAGAVGTGMLPATSEEVDSNPNSYALTGALLAGMVGVYNVKDYGAKGDARTDDAPAITAAVSAVPAQGGIIYFPPGVYLLNSSVVVHARTDLTFVGAGVSATRLQMNADGVTVLSFTGVCSRIAIRDLWLGAVAAYSFGGSVSVVGTSTVHSDTFVIENLRLQNTPAPWFSQFLDGSEIRNVRVMQTIPKAIKNVAMLMNSCVSDMFAEVQMLSTAGKLAGEGVRLDYDCDTIIFIDSQVLHAGTYGWRCAQTAGHTGPRLCRFTNCYAESATNSGWLIEAARDVRLSGCHAAVNAGNGFEIRGGDSIALSDSLALQNGRHGIFVAGGNGVKVDGNTCSNNSQEATTIYSGIRVDNGVTGARVVNNRSGDFIFSLPNRQRYGISLSPTGTDSLLVTGNDLRGNAAGALEYSYGPGHIVTRNIGLAPISISEILVAVSPFTYTNKSASAEIIYIAGGTVSSIAKNGTKVFTSSPCTVFLDPGDAITVTYSAIPAMHRDTL